MNRSRSCLRATLATVLLARSAFADPVPPDNVEAPTPLPDVASPAEEPAEARSPEPQPSAPEEPPTAPVTPPSDAAPSATFPEPAPSTAPASATPAPGVQAEAPAPMPPRRSEEPSSSQFWNTTPAPPNADAGVRSEEPRKRDDSWGLLGPIRLGPVIGVGLPNLVNFGGALKITRYFGAGVNVGIIPTVKIVAYGKAEVSYQEYDVYGRIYPFGGGFFLGTGIGYESAKGKFSKTMDISSYARQYPELGIPSSISSSSRGSVQALVLTPQLGYFKIFGSGFCVGVDVGAQVPIAPGKIELETDVMVPGASPQVREQVYGRYVDPAEKEVRDTLEAVARTPIPTFNLRIGWML